MVLRRYGGMVGTVILSALIVFYFACYGAVEQFGPGFKLSYLVVKYIIHGEHYRALFYGLMGNELWYTVRLVLMSFIFASIIGIGLPMLFVRVKSRIAQGIVQSLAVLFESVPEPMYIMLVALLTVFLADNYSMSIPVFPVADPNFTDTYIPAFALALPSGLYLSRILYLRLSDEQGSQYALVARAKGASPRRVFFGHLLVNILPAYLRQIPVMCAIILSSEIFAEYFLNYQGFSFYLGMYGFGAISHIYEPGVIFLIGLLLVGLWLVFRLISQILMDARYPETMSYAPAVAERKVNPRFLTAGIVMLLIVIFCALFPHLIDGNSATKWHLTNAQSRTAPWAPSATYPMGTDSYGRDLLARTLQGTWVTLYPVVVTTLCIYLGALLISSLAVRNRNGWLVRFVKGAGSTLSALPVLLLLLVVMHVRNLHSPYQEVVYIAWIVVFEVGRSAYAFSETYAEWYQFGFVEGATSIGRSRISILYTHFRKWLGQFSLEFFFMEFSRVVSLMTMLAAFKVYAVEKMIWPPFLSLKNAMILGSGQNTWFSMIGDVASNLAIISYPYWLYAPLIFLLLTTIGANLIARGLRGGTAK